MSSRAFASAFGLADDRLLSNSSASDYSLMFGYAGKLPSAELLEAALSADAWSVTVCALFGLRAYLNVARRIATLLVGTKSMPQALADEADFEARWRDLDALYSWASMAADLALRGDKGDAFARANLEVNEADLTEFAAPLTPPLCAVLLQLRIRSGHRRRVRHIAAPRGT